MKLRVLLLGFFFAVTTAVSAQNYSFETVNKATYVFSDWNVKDMHLRLKNNTSSTISITWMVDQMLDTNKWGSFAFCDPNLCYYNLEKGSENMGEITAHSLGDFKLSVKAKQTTQLDTYRIVFHETSNPSVVDTLTYILDARSLGIDNSVREAKNISLHPNPAVNMLNLDIPGTKHIIIYDMQGQAILTEDLSGKTLPVESLKSGVYMLQAVSGNQLYRARFVKE